MRRPGAAPFAPQGESRPGRLRTRGGHAPMRRGAPPLESGPRMVLPFRVLCSLWIALLLALSGSASLAAEDTTRQVLDATRAALNDIDVAMKSADLNDSDLAR